MKILLALTLIPFALSAQYGDNPFYDGLTYMPVNSRFRSYSHDPNTFYAKKEARLNGVRTMKKYAKRKSGEVVVETFNYNEKGLVTSVVTPKKTTLYTYQSDTLLTDIVSTWKNGDVAVTKNEYENGRCIHSFYLVNGKKNVETYTTFEDGKKVMESRETWYSRKPRKTVMHFNQNNQILAEEVYRGGKQVAQYTHTYNEKGKSLVREHIYMAKKKQHISRLENTYNEEGKLIKTIHLYDGVVKTTWDYSCNDDKGRVIDTKVEEVSSVCTFREEFNDGSYSVFTRTIRNGKTYLEQNRYDADSVLIGTREFLHDSILTFETQYNAEFERQDRYNHKGKYYYGYEYRFDEDMNIIALNTFNKRRALSSCEKVKFNKEGLVESIEFSGRKGKDPHVNRYEYTYAP